MVGGRFLRRLDSVRPVMPVASAHLSRHRATLLVFAVAVLGGCRDHLAAQAERLEVRLDELHAEIARAETDADMARRSAETERCRAKVEALRATIESRRAECLAEVARERQCQAGREMKTGDATLLGCIGGLVLAVGSAGSAVPWALAGCAGGRAVGEVTQDGCPSPKCAESLGSVEAQVLEGSGLKALPQCGGYLGVVVKDGHGHRVGQEIGEVIAGTTAEALGLQEHDVVVSVDRRDLAGEDSIPGLLRSHQFGDQVDVTFVRGDRLLMARAALVPIAGEDDDDGPSKKLGFRNGPMVASTGYAWGVVVDQVDKDGPAAAVGVRPGDYLATFDGTELASPADLAGKIGERRAGDTVRFGIRHARAAPQTVAVVLVDRRGRSGL